MAEKMQQTKQIFYSPLTTKMELESRVEWGEKNGMGPDPIQTTVGFQLENLITQK